MKANNNPLITDLLANFALRTDAYKQTHWKQYPKGTEVVYSYLESRGGEFPATVFFGLQYYLRQYLSDLVITEKMVNQADEFCKKTFAADYFNKEGWLYIVKTYGGKLPIRIKAAPEGAVIPVSNALMTIENTDPKVPFLTNFVETMLMKIWYPITVATLSYTVRQIEKKYADICGVGLNPFFLNDFGYRGASSEESAGIGGMAHLINYLGTDTMRGVIFAMNYYDAPDVCGYSVMAAEHSTVTIYGRENEAKAYETFLDEYPVGLVSIVSDSYDLYNAIENIFGKQLKEKVLAREGKLVVRPDSGYPPEVCLKSLQLLWEAFGGTVNERGYKVLNPKVGIIYGDGINPAMVEKILEKVVLEGGFSVENVVFGMGGALLQQVNRDTCKFALKCSAGLVNGEWRDVFKEPKTDSGKNSKRGKLELFYNKAENKYFTESVNYTPKDGEVAVLETVFENGEILKEYTFDEIKARVSE